jgi:pimeloyl-ACP methyl ester carboxylesterase
MASEILVDVDGVRLAGAVHGEGEPLLLLHGGPSLGRTYLDSLLPELVHGHRVASYQQRGLPPSSTEGPFTIADHVADARRVLDALGWEKAVVVGHSWGGHLALHVARALPDRVRAVLAVDPLGAVGDGGELAFGTAMRARTPDQDWRRVEELDERAMRGEATPEDDQESLRLVWPAYFPSRAAAPPMPTSRSP